jgi:hypothetical protein
MEDSSRMNEKVMKDTWGDADYFFIDEVSQVTPEALSNIEARIRQVMGIQEPFGGKSIILVGDFFQLPPVMGSGFLYTALLRSCNLARRNGNHAKYCVNPKSAYAKGIVLFRLFAMQHIEIPFRCKDPVLAMHQLSMRSFHLEQPVTDALLSMLENSVLTQDDVQRDPFSWTEAPMGVTGNIERFRLTPVRAIAFAKLTGVPVLVWPLKSKGPLLGNVVATHGHDAVYTPASGLMGMFVKGAPAYMTENVCVPKQLCNGTSVRMHSLSFSQTVPKDVLHDMTMRIAHAVPGEIVRLPIAPEYVNVDVHMDKKRLQSWPRDQTLIPGQVVIPISTCSRPDEVKFCVPASGGMPSEQGTARVTNHRVEMGFMVTVHKTQSRTMFKLMLDLCLHTSLPPPFTHNMLYVALTRVQYANDIRILPLDGPYSLAYLKKLKPDPDLEIYLAGFLHDHPDKLWREEVARAHLNLRRARMAGATSSTRRSTPAAKAPLRRSLKPRVPVPIPAAATPSTLLHVAPAATSHKRPLPTVVPVGKRRRCVPDSPPPVPAVPPRSRTMHIASDVHALVVPMVPPHSPLVVLPQHVQCPGACTVGVIPPSFVRAWATMSMDSCFSALRLIEDPHLHLLITPSIQPSPGRPEPPLLPLPLPPQPPVARHYMEFMPFYWFVKTTDSRGVVTGKTEASMRCDCEALRTLCGTSLIQNRVIDDFLLATTLFPLVPPPGIEDVPQPRSLFCPCTIFKSDWYSYLMPTGLDTYDFTRVATLNPHLTNGGYLQRDILIPVHVPGGVGHYFLVLIHPSCADATDEGGPRSSQPTTLYIIDSLKVRRTTQANAIARWWRDEHIARNLVAQGTSVIIHHGKLSVLYFVHINTPIHIRSSIIHSKMYDILLTLFESKRS